MSKTEMAILIIRFMFACKHTNGAYSIFSIPKRKKEKIMKIAEKVILINPFWPPPIKNWPILPYSLIQWHLSGWKILLPLLGMNSLLPNWNYCIHLESTNIWMDTEEGPPNEMYLSASTDRKGGTWVDKKHERGPWELSYVNIHPTLWWTRCLTEQVLLHMHSTQISWNCYPCRFDNIGL